MQNRPKAGEHRAHIACHTGLRTHAYDITLAKEQRSREHEERVVADAVLRVAAFHCGVLEASIPGWPLAAQDGLDDRIDSCVTWALAGLDSGGGGGVAGGAAKGQDVAVAALLAGEVSCVEISGEVHARQVVVDAPRRGGVVLPGSFNPLHDGHTCAPHAYFLHDV